MSDDAVFHPETGEYLGEMLVADDGSRVLVSDAGEILSAMAEDGSPLDPADFSFEADAETGGDFTGFEDRIAGLEQRVEQLPQYDRAANRELAREAVTQDHYQARFLRELENVENQLGRKMSNREAWRILEDYNADHEAGVEPNVWKSATTVDLADTSTSEGRVQRAMDSLDDSEQQHHPDARPWHEPASGSDSDVRVARALNALDHGVTSAEQAEQDQILSEEED